MKTPLQLGGDPSDRVTLVSAATLTTWLACLVVGGIGLAAPYKRPVGKISEQPVQVEMVRVELVAPPPPPPVEVVPQLALSEPAALPPMEAPPAPPVALAALPSPAIAFAIPVEGPATVVEAVRAVPARVEKTGPKAVAVAAPEILVFGQGEGLQPAPDYPVRAMKDGQEGAVEVRFSVGADGAVLQAEVAAPSPWPLLNNAALRVVREKWRLRPGPARRCEVTIRFQLVK